MVVTWERKDAELVAQVLQSDPEVYTQLVERYRDAIYGLAYHCVGNFEEARDLAQETFIKAYLHLSQLREWEKFGPWLRQIATHECQIYLRKRRDQVSLEELAARNEEPAIGDEPAASDNRWVYRWTDLASGTWFEDTIFVAANRGKEWQLAFVTGVWAEG